MTVFTEHTEPSGGRSDSSFLFASVGDYGSSNETLFECSEGCIEDQLTAASHSTTITMLAKLFYYITTMIVTTTTVVANAAVLWRAVARRSVDGLRFEFYVALSVTDLMIGISVMPLMIVEDHSDHWNFGRSLCRAWILADAVLGAVSSVTLCFGSVDLCILVVVVIGSRPNRRCRRLTYAAAALLTSVVWTLALAVSGVMYFEENEIESGWSENPTPCVTSRHVVYATAGLFYVLLSVAVFAYLCLFFYIRASSAKAMTAVFDVAESISLLTERKDAAKHEDNSPKDSRVRQTSDEFCKRSSEFQFKCKEFDSWGSIGDISDTRKQGLDSPKAIQQPSALLQSTIITFGDDESKSESKYKFYLSSKEFGADRMSGSCPELRCSVQRPNSRMNAGASNVEIKSAQTAKSTSQSAVLNFDTTTSRMFRNGRRKNFRMLGRKSILSMGILLASSIGCRLPFISTQILTSVSEFQFRTDVATLLFWIGHLNSFFNPLTYAVFQR